MRTHQFSTSPGRCVGKGGRPGWRGRGEPSRARAPRPGPLSTGRAARAWLPGSTAVETGPWPGAQRPPRGAGQPADRTGEVRLSRPAGTRWANRSPPSAVGSPVTQKGSPNSQFQTPRPTSKIPGGLRDKTEPGTISGCFFFSQVGRLRSG